MNKSLEESLELYIQGPAADLPVVLTQRRIFILPTARGLGFVLLLLLLLLIAFVYNNNLAYLLTFLLASVFFITILHTFLGMNGLSLQKGQSKPVFAGDPAGFVIHIDNPSTKAREHIELTLEDTVSVTVPPSTKIAVTLLSATHQRGWHEAGKVTVANSYPFGLFRAWSPIRFGLQVLVYPKPTAHSVAFPESSAIESQQGVSKKGTDDFYGLQSYQAGDSIKHIHWKTFAKGLGVFSKQYGGGSAAELWLDYAETPGHSTEERLSQLCRWVLDAEQAGVRYGLVLPSIRFSPNIGEAHASQCLEALALF
jgi:uncharacterized protein (DUF58 family)